LIKPSKGCNVDIRNVLKTLLSLKEMKDTSKINAKQDFNFLLDSIVEKGLPLSELQEILPVSESLEYFSGYWVRRSITFTDCPDCRATVCTSRKDYEVTSRSEQIQCPKCKWKQSPEKDTACPDCYIFKKSESVKQVKQHSSLLLERDIVPHREDCGLVYPSSSLCQLVAVVERSFNEEIKMDGNANITADTLWDIINSLNEKDVPIVGCDEHKLSFNKRIYNFLLITRSYFILKCVNADNANKEKSKKLKKNAKFY